MDSYSSYASHHLLFFKPVVLRKRMDRYSFEGVSEWFKTKQIFKATCRQGHKDIPNDNCMCGITGYLALPPLKEYWNSGGNIGIFQALGKTTVDGIHVRTAGIYLWGLLDDPENENRYATVWAPKDEDWEMNGSPYIYTPSEADHIVRYSAFQHGFASSFKPAKSVKGFWAHLVDNYSIPVDWRKRR